MNLVPVTYVQVRSTGEFMCEDPDVCVGYTRLISNATPFYSHEEALETAVDHLDSDFVLFSCHIWQVH